MEKVLVAQEYICPTCGADSLDFQESAVECGQCGRRYEVRKGIPVFREAEARFDWGVSREKMEALVSAAEEIGWHDAMMELLSDLPLKEAVLVWNRTFGPRRSAMNMLLPLHTRARVLDIGCGWGTISMNLSRCVGRVVAFDQSYQHLEWVQAACHARGIENVTVVQGGDTNYLPFPADSFDVAIMNGVLEWVATNTNGNPEQVQQRFLSEVARVLKPSGVLFVGIENRWNYNYFRGAREGHINMKYGALLPRFMTDLYLRLTRGVRYREYTYTLFGYRKLLRKAGLGHRRFYSPWPHYGRIQYVLPLEAEGDPVSNNWVVETGHRFARRPESYFSHTYLMTATPEVDAPSVIDRVLADIASELGWTLPVTLTGELFRVTSTGKAALKMLGPSGSGFFARVGLTREAAQGVRNHHEAIRSLALADLGHEIESKLPRPLLGKEVDGFVYSVEPFFEGRKGDVVTGEEAGRAALCEDAFDFIVTLALKMGRRVTVDEEIFRLHFSEPLLSLRKWFTRKEWEVHGPWIESVMSAMRRRLMKKEMLVVPRHGDFVPENCLLDGSGRLCKVLDWEFYEREGLPLYDWITFLGVAHRPRVKRMLATRGTNPDSVRFHGYPQIFIEGGLNEELNNYLDRLGMDASLLHPLLFMWWAKQLQDWERDMLYHPEWRRFRVFPLIERLRDLAKLI